MADDVKVVDASPSIFWTRHILRELGTRGKLSRPKVVFDVLALKAEKARTDLLSKSKQTNPTAVTLSPRKTKGMKTLPYFLYRNTPEDQALGIWVLGWRCRCAQPLGRKTEVASSVCAHARRPLQLYRTKEKPRTKLSKVHRTKWRHKSRSRRNRDTLNTQTNKQPRQHGTPEGPS